LLAKALSGGFYPVSAVLANAPVMDVLKLGQHGSTFGANALGSKIAMAALEVVKDEQLPANSLRIGILLRETREELASKSPLIGLVRGKGLLNALVVNDTEESSTAWEICLALRDAGLLAKPTHGNIIRFSPPLVITEEQLLDCCQIIEGV